MGTAIISEMDNAALILEYDKAYDEMLVRLDDGTIVLRRSQKPKWESLADEVARRYQAGTLTIEEIDATRF